MCRNFRYFLGASHFTSDSNEHLDEPKVRIHIENFNSSNSR